MRPSARGTEVGGKAVEDVLAIGIGEVATAWDAPGKDVMGEAGPDMFMIGTRRASQRWLAEEAE